ncbi:hypothetical protein D3C75_1100170 [compost metagenome]
MTTAAVINQQTLAAPQGAALTITETIQRQANHGTAFQWPTVLGQASGQMRMMMQHRGHRQ